MFHFSGTVSDLALADNIKITLFTGAAFALYEGASGRRGLVSFSIFKRLARLKLA